MADAKQAPDTASDYKPQNQVSEDHESASGQQRTGHNTRTTDTSVDAKWKPAIPATDAADSPHTV